MLSLSVVVFVENLILFLQIGHLFRSSYIVISGNIVNKLQLTTEILTESVNSNSEKVWKTTLKVTIISTL